MNEIRLAYPGCARVSPISIWSISSTAEGSVSRISDVVSSVATKSANCSTTNAVLVGTGTRPIVAANTVTKVPSDEHKSRAGFNCGTV